MNADDYFNKHIPHRVNLMITFKKRYSGQHPERNLDKEYYRDLFRCAKDISLLMIRFFCEEIGLKLSKKDNEIYQYDDWDKKIIAKTFSIKKLSDKDIESIKSDHRYNDLIEVLKAANRAVAHIDENDVDHSFIKDTDDEKIFIVIDWIEELVKKKIYESAGQDYNYSMALPNNVM